MTVDELLTSKGITYRPGGKDLVIPCLNPDHDDKNPSLRVDKTTGVFNCLSCGFSGNIFNHFGEKANWLQIRRERVKDVIKQKLHEATGLNIPENAVPFEQEWRGISADTFRRFEAFQHNNSEYIGRVVFPIRNITGKIVAFCGRHQGDASPKYLFHPSKTKIPMFPSVVKPLHGRVIMVEGLFDMMNLYDKGLTNVICAFGVNTINQDKINILKIQGIYAIDILFDSDDAGQKGAKALKELAEKNDMEAHIFSLTNVKDPGEMTALQVLNLKEELYSA